MKLSEVLAYLDIDRATFYRWRAKGQAPRCIRQPSGQLRFRPADVEAWLAARGEEPLC
ncbi:excisionase [Mangrovactinospora gilvigrisea]|uniref:Excisionase n=2 Tax=Mangrovactinospora gilvigrisea TaxID=1428644 RepID=A0A1J7CAF2_9ACTN|nr:helix-turn-helix domain-containing protein [Mangrovactinospora gilvigrisea]OIV38492.1 excisionase [Mangrovactinospora gilvigrisea]